MSPESLKAWRLQLRLSQEEAADALGLSRRGYQMLEAGKRPIAKYYALACAALAFGFDDRDKPTSREQIPRKTD